MLHAVPTMQEWCDHMRLTANKTWSQQELATKLHLTGTSSRGLLSWERRRLLIHAAKTALAAGLCWWLASRLGLHDGYWGAISAIIVLQSNFGATITASRDRVLGTVIGALFGFSFSLLGSVPWNYYPCGLRGDRDLRTARIPQQLAPGGSDDHDHHAGAVKFSLDACADPRGAGTFRHSGGSRGEHA